MSVIDLREPFRTQVENGIAKLNDDRIPYVITSTVRLQATQFLLWLQGRLPESLIIMYRMHLGLSSLTTEDMERIVTQTDGVILISNHQKGLAIDIVPSDTNGKAIWPFSGDARWKEISSRMVACGCVWGGDWLDFPDLPHYEMKGADSATI